MPHSPDSIGIYIHVPYCYSKCSYCDFDSYAMGGSGRRDRYAPAAVRETIPLFVDSLIGEICAAQKKLNSVHALTPSSTGSATTAGSLNVQTVFFGGGTPSILNATQIKQILDAVNANFAVFPEAEVTMEANPESLVLCSYSALRKAGVNRMSIGVQSLDKKILRTLGRPHGPSEAAAAFRQARMAGMDDLNLDLIYGVPGQSLDIWRKTLDEALSLGPDHVSLYCLSVHEGTPMAAKVEKRFGGIENWEEAAEDLQAQMYDLAVETLSSAGLERYETSNFARPGHQCRHNMIYWQSRPYIGFGPGAHSHLRLPGSPDQARAIRWANAPGLYEYLGGEWNPSPGSVEILSEEKAMSEAVFLSLRTSNGLDLDAFASRFGRDFFEVYPAQWERLSSQGVLQQKERAVQLAPWTALVANQFLCEFI